MPLRPFVELTVLAEFPHVAHAYPGGDLARMPEAELAELWTMARARRTDHARAVAGELGKALEPFLAAMAGAAV